MDKGEADKYMKRRYKLCLLIVTILMSCCSCSQKTISEDGFEELVIGGTSYSPYFYKDMNGQYVGIDVDVAEEVCRRIGYTPVFKEIPIAERFDDLEAGKVDCLWSCLTMYGREKEFLWAGPYLYTQRVVMVHADSDIKTLKDLEGKRVSVQTGSTSESIVIEQKNENLSNIQQLTSFSELSEVFMALRKGYVDAAIGHESSLLGYSNEYPGEYKLLKMSLRSDPIGVAFPKSGDEELVQQMKQVMQEMREDGTLEKIIEKYDLDIQKNVYGGSANEQEEK